MVEKMQATFSVIIPVYNEKDFLTKCVQSVSRTAVPVEMILVDDGSSDGSSELCDALGAADDRITVVHQKNGGLSAARNTGLSAATGKYVVFLDSDDYLAPDALDDLARCLQANAEVDVLITRVTEFFPDGTILDRDPRMERFVSGLPGKATKNDAIAWVFHESDCASIAPRFIVRTAFLREKKLRFEEGRLHEDIAWTIELMAHANTFCFCTRRWYYYRKAVASSISANVQVKNIEDVIYFTKKYLPMTDFDDLTAEQKDRVRGSLSSGCCYILSKSAGLSRENKRRVAETLGSAEVLSYTKKPRHRIFVRFMRLAGCQNAVMCLAAMLEWKMRVRSIANCTKS